MVAVLMIMEGKEVPAAHQLIRHDLVARRRQSGETGAYLQKIRCRKCPAAARYWPAAISDWLAGAERPVAGCAVVTQCVPFAGYQLLS